MSIKRWLASFVLFTTVLIFGTSLFVDAENGGIDRDGEAAMVARAYEMSESNQNEEKGVFFCREDEEDEIYAEMESGSMAELRPDDDFPEGKWWEKKAVYEADFELYDAKAAVRYAKTILEIYAYNENKRKEFVLSSIYFDEPNDVWVIYFYDQNVESTPDMIRDLNLAIRKHNGEVVAIWFDW